MLTLSPAEGGQETTNPLPGPFLAMERSMLKEATDQRPFYAGLMREVAENLEHAPEQPIGVFIQVHLHSGTVWRLHKFEPGFDLLRAIGIAECMKHDFLDEIQDAERVEHP